MTSSTLTPYKTRFQTHLAAIEPALENYLALQEPQVLWKAMRHGVLNGGKRIRPVMLLECCLAAGGSIEQALPTACGLELIHCYSLIHDDLPCIDNDDLRRGKPTVHKVYGEDMAVLAGDALLAMAFGLITDTPDVAPVQLLRVVRELSRSASVYGLVNGQVEDILAENTKPDASVLVRIHAGKTGALFRFATWAGGVLAGLPEEAVESLGKFGERLGVTFQLVDDLLDIHATGETLGKTPGKDQAQGKMTFPAVYGVEGAQEMLAGQVAELHSLLDSLAAHMNVDNLRYLVEYIETRES